MASDDSDQDARYALSKLLQGGTVSAPQPLGEAFSIARIMEARFETIKGKKLNIEEKIDIVLSWPSEEAPPSNVESMKVRSEFNEFSENKESVEEVVVGGGEACGVGEDELNRVISALKDGCGEFDSRLDEINLNLREELADNGVSPIPTSLVAYESSRARQLWERIGIGDAHGLRDNGRNHKFVQPNVWEWMSTLNRHILRITLRASGKRKRKKGVGCGSGRQENYRSGRRDCGRIGYEIPESRYILDITLRTRWL
ncbi:hypothetical protein Tco_0782105 [Tanacetum coccineum]